MRPCIVASLALLLLGCRETSPGARVPSTPPLDSGFAGVQERGQEVMGVNQYTSRHVFQPLPDGGRIELQRSVEDNAGAAQIRRHMRVIAHQFATGDFRLPGVVHARDVPGTGVMAEKRAVITYTVESLPHGGAVRVRSRDPEAIRAIHEFLAFQRRDHHSPARADS